MRIECWTPTATNAHGEYVILTAFPLQQRLHERASLLRYTYNARLVVYRYVLVCCYKAGIFSLALLLSDYSVVASDFDINALCWIDFR
jgi:hypothetical protein